MVRSPLRCKYLRRCFLGVAGFLWLSSAPALMAESIVADHTVVTAFRGIPLSVIEQAGGAYRVLYGHTSHGSQILTGMQMLSGENPAYGYNGGVGSLSVQELGWDLQTLGDTAWVVYTRQELDKPENNANLVIWSWCGGVSGNTVEGIDAYLDAMTRLEAEYPSVTFVYMTGHLDGTGPTGNLYARNNQIRDYCRTHDKTLFDFADIESYDPAGTWYPDGTDACEWCAEWCATHSCPTCGDCAHSHCVNCYRKGHAFWWLLAQLTGWRSGPCCINVAGNVDGDPQDKVNLVDLSALISYLTAGSFVPSCPAEANITADPEGRINLVDLTALISYLTGGPFTLPACPMLSES